MEHAVGAGPDAQPVLLRFDVHVGRAGAHRGFEDQVDDLDDGRVLVDVDALLRLLRGGGSWRAALSASNWRSASVISAVGAYALTIACSISAGVATNMRTGARTASSRRARRSGRNGSAVATSTRLPSRRTGIERSSQAELLAEQLRELGVELGAGEVDRLEPGLLGERAGELAFGDEPELHEHVAEAFAARALRGQRFAELVFGEDAAPDEQRAERCALVLRRVRDFERRRPARRGLGVVRRPGRERAAELRDRRRGVV